MQAGINIEALLAPIPGDNPSGEDLRYSGVYDEIKEARRADEVLEMGEWRREIKTSDWNEVIRLSLDALERRSKDLQIAAWLSEALVMNSGFSGLGKGLAVINGLLRNYWDSLYPMIDGEDLDYRIAPLEFLNDKLGYCVCLVPLTEPGATPGYSLLKWRESREVGSEADTKNRYGDTDDNKKERRDALLAEGKIPAEEFDSCANRSSGAFCGKLAADLSACMDAFNSLDGIVDEIFGKDAPKLSNFGDALAECRRLVSRFYGEPAGAKDENPDPGSETAAVSAGKIGKGVTPQGPVAPVAFDDSVVPDQGGGQSPTPPLSPFSGEVAPLEDELWREALGIMQNGGFRSALNRLLSTCNSQPSERGRSRYSLLVAKLCLKAERPDLARPIMEQLYARITELQLDRWESPPWIAEVLDALYQCLVSGDPSDDDMARAGELFRRICTLNVTQALEYGK